MLPLQRDSGRQSPPWRSRLPGWHWSSKVVSVTAAAAKKAKFSGRSHGQCRSASNRGCDQPFPPPSPVPSQHFCLLRAPPGAGATLIPGSLGPFALTRRLSPWPTLRPQATGAREVTPVKLKGCHSDFRLGRGEGLSTCRCHHCSVMAPLGRASSHHRPLAPLMDVELAPL